MSSFKQVKVDNWGVYFLQRLKHFFNRTDYCDLTLQFQDNAQLKVHRLVLNACTEYFELLERTCEMYEDCLIMPDDLQADVVVPIVNFMYTGQLEFRPDILEKLYQTSQIMNMPVLTKLLNSHRILTRPPQKYSSIKRYSKSMEKKVVTPTTPVPSTSNKRSYSKAFDSNDAKFKDRIVYINKPEPAKVPNMYLPPSPHQLEMSSTPKRSVPVHPRPTRYELPEELDTDNVFDNSFTNISYTSQPLMVHPETVKQYSSRRSGVLNDTKRSKNMERLSTVDIVECKKISNNSNIFDDSINDTDTDMYQSPFIKSEPDKISSSQLFDQILDSNDSPKLTIETKDSKSANKMDHAKIISEVLKKYPHLVKSNKVIKLKVLNSPNKVPPKKQVMVPKYKENTKAKIDVEPDFTYEVDVLDSKEAAKLIAMGAENIKGPWICLICGTPGRALHFTSYYKYRRHLVEVHNEKPVMNICEYCGLRSAKRNCLLHHLYSKHGVEPPPSHHFPKCNQCTYIGLSEALLVKHKLSHIEGRHFRCNVCDEVFITSNQLLQHIQSTGHKYSAERKTNLQCIYCLKVFLRQTNLYAHLKSNHKNEAKKDGIIEESEDEKETKCLDLKVEQPSYSEYEEVDIQYKIQQRPDGNIQLVPKKQQETPSKQKILNADFSTSKPAPKEKSVKNTPTPHNVPVSSNNEDEEIVMIDSEEYIVRDNLLIPRNNNVNNIQEEEYVIPNTIPPLSDHTIQTVTPTTSMEFTSIHTTTADENMQQQNMIIKNSTNLNQPIQIVVSNEEEYKALISSNHPIIFDNTDASKTLAVLTAPHGTNIGTINMNNTQSNDMMIIQENFPLNVSEAVATDNSNIVVVYSHHLNQDKQFQLLTPEGVDEQQFVQSSTIITQNYETITTSTPVMSAHVLETPVTESWQQTNSHQSIQNEQIQIPTETVIHNINPEISQAENENTDITELPEVHLQLNVDKLSGEVITVDSNLNENSEMIIQQDIECDQSVTNADAMEVDQPLVETAEKIIVPIESSENANNLEEEPSVKPETIEVHASDVMEAQTESECNVTELASSVTEEPQELVAETQEETSTECQLENAETSSDMPTIQENENETQADVDVPEEEAPSKPSVDSESTVKEPEPEPEPNQEAVSKIQAFASEWSEEDEFECLTSDNPKTNGTSLQDDNLQGVKQNTSHETIIAVIDSEVEESIESIQQEIEKQMSIPPAMAADVNERLVNTLREDNLNNSKKRLSTEANGNSVGPQENISSILNDWDDNDSQEENEQSTDDLEISRVTETQPVQTVPVVEKSVPDKLDSKPDVKSLVSDWDDDEDEEEENKT